MSRLQPSKKWVKRLRTVVSEKMLYVYWCASSISFDFQFTCRLEEWKWTHHALQKCPRMKTCFCTVLWWLQKVLWASHPVKNKLFDQHNFKIISVDLVSCWMSLPLHSPSRFGFTGITVNVVLRSLRDHFSLLV